MTGHGLAWAGIAGGAVVLGAVAVLLDRTLQPTREILAYTEDIGASIDAIAENLSAGTELLRTRELAVAVPGLAQRLLAGAA
jgi:hypothetical protein